MSKTKAKVFQILGGDGFQQLTDLNWKKIGFKLDGTGLKRKWVPQEVSFRKQRGRIPTIFTGVAGGLVFDDQVADLLRLAWGPSGELLPLIFGEQTLWLLNITRCGFIWRPADEKKKATTDLFPIEHIRKSLFKIPEQVEDIYCLRKQDAKSFKALYEKHGLTGLAFTEV